MGDLFDTLSGITGAVLYAWLGSHEPAFAWMGIGFFIGMMSMRMTRGYFVKNSPDVL